MIKGADGVAECSVGEQSIQKGHSGGFLPE